jgi:23S rRNA (cytidine1920-2'-O)/16S rRNA (cytidine1409-2'-O)-methyltransferase
MRIDHLLVKRGFFSTRQKAKEAIKRGEVFVDGRRIEKHSEDVNFSAKIEVLGEERPKGYWKLKNLNEKWSFINKSSRIIDLGSSAGGFLLYASEIAEFVLGIEYSREFEKELSKIRRENVEIIFEDAFRIDINSLRRYGRFNVILNDLTLKPEDSLKALSRFSPLVKGYALFVAKTGIDSKIPEIGWEIIAHEVSNAKKEEYFLLKIE